jgi:hypothetical protein
MANINATRNPRIENLQEYCLDRAARQAAGWVNGKVHLEGRFYTQEEFDALFPAELKYRAIQIDSTQLV